MNQGTPQAVTPQRIMELGLGFMSAKVLLTAVKLGLFTRLAGSARGAREIQAELGLHERGLFDFLDALVALGLLERDGDGRNAPYRNARDTELYLVRDRETYVGGILEMADDRLYPFWADLADGLKTGEPQNEIRHSGEDLFETLYEDPDRLRQFMSAMVGAQLGSFLAFAEKFDFSPYETLCDVGGASGALAIEVARRHRHMRCISADLPAVEPVARENIRRAGLNERVAIRALDFWQDDFPEADIITMGNILHDWDLESRRVLISKAHRALSPAGALVVIEAIIDDARRECVPGLLMSLNMLIETPGGANFSGAEFRDWVLEAGFRHTQVIPLAGATSAAVAYK